MGGGGEDNLRTCTTARMPKPPRLATKQTRYSMVLCGVSVPCEPASIVAAVYKQAMYLSDQSKVWAVSGESCLQR